VRTSNGRLVNDVAT